MDIQIKNIYHMLKILIHLENILEYIRHFKYIFKETNISFKYNRIMNIL